ncbi:MAG: putative transcriptional regulator with domain [Francisellaceae bacterium]|nr:putative transcriptional regulator with domain [Francisellaceae bacterium]
MIGKPVLDYLKLYMKTNKLILKTLYRSGEIEELGIETQEMISACRILRIPQPEFKEQNNTFIVIFRKKKISDHNIINSKSLLSDEQQNLNIRQNKVLSILQNHKSLTRIELRKLLNEEFADRALQKDLVLLKEYGLVNSEGRGPIRDGF